MLVFIGVFLLVPCLGLNITVFLLFATIPIFSTFLLLKLQFFLLLSSANRELEKEKMYLKDAHKLSVQFGLKPPKIFFASLTHPLVFIRGRKHVFYIVSGNTDFEVNARKLIQNKKYAEEIFNLEAISAARNVAASGIYHFLAIFFPKNWQNALRMFIGICLYPNEQLDRPIRKVGEK